MLRIAHHQLWHSLLRVKTLEENEAELAGDGHFDLVAVGQLEGSFGSVDTFDDTVHGGLNSRKAFADSEAAAQLLVATERTGTGGDEVTDTGKPGKGEGMCASGDAKAGDLGQTTSDESGFGIFAIGHAVVKPCTDGDDVFECTTQFDADDIIGGIDAVMDGGEDGADTDGNLFIMGSDNGSRWFKFGHFAGDVRTTESGDT